MTGPHMVTIGAPCPVCGCEAEWTGTRQPTAGDSTSYVVACPRCDLVVPSSAAVAVPVAVGPASVPASGAGALLARLRASYGITREAS